MGGLHSRNKGAQFERDIANELTALLGRKVNRKLGQARDSGNDIDVPPFRMELKRYNKIGVYSWLKQCVASCKPGDIPVVVARADEQKAIAILLFEDFKSLMMGRVAQSGGSIFD